MLPPSSESSVVPIGTVNHVYLVLLRVPSGFDPDGKKPMSWETDR